MSDYSKIHDAIDYLNTINRKWFKLNVMTICVPYGENNVFKKENSIILGTYQPAISKEGERYGGKITFNVESVLKMEQESIRELVRHEYAHAVADLKYNKHHEGHGRTWIMIAKLMRVNTKRYELELN